MSASDLSLPHLAQRGGRWQLLVDGRPFLILGLQWSCDSCFSAEEMLPLFAEAARMGANTAVLPVYWREIEPREGEYDFTLVDARLRGAAAAGLRLVLLWFATWKNASPFYAPAYVRDDVTTYPRARDRHGRAVISHCPLAESTRVRDATALAALLEYLRAHEHRHAVIMLQIENEPGLLGTDRCYCAVCTERFEQGGWQARYGTRAAEAFTADAVARYIDAIAARAKQLYPLPMYVNAWLGGGPGSYPGIHYPSGGPVPAMIEVWRAAAPHLDFVAPDIYTTSDRRFAQLCSAYRAGQPLYIAEHASAPAGRAERNVFYALGEHGAIGFDPWAIDEAFPRGPGAVPLVDPIDRRWAPHAYALRDSYVALRDALLPIAAAQGTDQLFTFVQEPGDGGTAWRTPDGDVIVHYEAADGMARGLIIHRAPGEYLLVGVGCGVSFRRPGDGSAIPMRLTEFGRFAGEQWIALHPMRREGDEAIGRPLYLRRPGVARIVLDLDHT